LSAKRILEKMKSSNQVIKPEDLFKDLKQISSMEKKKDINKIGMFSCKIEKRQDSGEF